MAERTTLHCDVTDRTNDVEEFVVGVWKQGKDAPPSDGCYIFYVRDLNPWALERLKKFIEKGVYPPGTKGGNGQVSEEPDPGSPGELGAASV